MALVGKRTAAAGGGDATVTTAAGVWGVIDAALVAAGWTTTDLAAGAPWAPSTVLPPVTVPYTIGTIVTNAGNRYQCIQSGNASTSPTGPTGVGQVITEGTCQWRFLTNTGAGDRFYSSTGESGNEKISIRVSHQSASTPAIVNMQVQQYFSGGSTGFGYNRITPGSATITQFSFTAGNTVNYALVADKDSFVGIFNDSANNRRIIGGGLLKRTPGTIATYFISNATVTAGPSKTYTFASGNPIAAGYKLGDRVFVLAQQANTADPYNTTIPSFAARITGLTTTSITIDQAQETTLSGALIGADPMPYFHYTNGNNFTIHTNANYLYCGYRWNPNVVNLYTAGSVDLGYGSASTSSGLVHTAQAEADPNNRTSRVIMGEHTFNITGEEVVGIVPQCFSNPRTTDALWTIARSVKEATNFDYVTFPANTASPASQRRETIGPFTVSGSAGYTIDLYRQNDTTTWIEAEQHDHISSTHAGISIFPQAVDKAFAVHVVSREGWPFQGELSDNGYGSLLDTDGNTFAWAVYLPNAGATPQGTDRTGGNQYGIGAAEPLPFDSPEAVSGGSGSAFNSGLN